MVRELAEATAVESHEKAIGYYKATEQFAYKFFMEVKKIRDNRYFEELGFSNFEQYCNSNFNLTSQYVNQKIQIANVWGEDSETRVSQLGHKKSLILARLPEPEREDFLESNPVEDMTTRELKQAIKEKKEAERRALEAERALQEERAKPPEVVEKVIEKKVERIPKDYIQVKDYARGLEEKMLKLRHQIDDLLAEKKSLENKAKENEITKMRSDEYQDLQRKIRDLAGQSSEMEKRLDAIGDISDFKRHVENMIQNELAPVKYTRAFREIQNESIILDNIKELLGRVTAWVAEITAIVEKSEASMYPYEEYKEYEEEEYERIDD